MVARIAIIALGAVCCIFSGCGCSKEKAGGGAYSRMQDAAYTNQLAQLKDRQVSVAAQASALRAKIEALGAEGKAGNTPEYADLTNQLAQCSREADRIRKEAQMTIRARLMKEAGPKRNLKK